MASTITLAEYLGRRLRQAGVGHLFGVPGDFNLTLLDHLTQVPGLAWVGSPNELGAGYAADAYARSRGLAVLVTTYGVGELSALNAVAGSAAEDVPVVHIAGSPSTSAVAARRLVHHTLADGEFGRFSRAYAEVTVHQETVTADRATAQIDAALAAAMINRKPVYLSIPMDLATLPVDPAPLANPLTGASDPAAFAAALKPLIDAAERPVIVAGHLVSRFGAADLTAVGVPIVTTLAAKGVIDADDPLSYGDYAGTMVDQDTADLVGRADLVIELGTVATDVLSGFFTHRPVDDQVVTVGATAATIGVDEVYPVHFADAVHVLVELLSAKRFVLPQRAPKLAVPAPAPDAPLTQAALWQTVQGWLPAGTAVLADTGTSFWGAVSLTFPADTVFVAQPIWNSIGYALPAVLGQGLAEPERRPVLFIGDGAAQMTVQELSTIAAAGINPIIVLLNNEGYTIERALQSPDAGYNDVAAWEWGTLVEGFAGPKADYRRAHTAAELRHALEAAAEATHTLCFVEVVLDRYDAPPLLRVLAERNGADQT
ncbi:alpha-keto acid decarboxylase family protein [Paractinoplanes durhamensis]|uniref:Alpha-keto-acid decarboxylase n=1 Tax=Paractinoplanes durhamensis TaxID=113563 RepID=A0ABQ3YZU0_9ACTN|nr:thiamine pyrophosphate-binding protein [Actinoplanes durhamensis]GIE03081.1 alpha-keto-acid decarboxylase [Actinoplanes durhamensis]